MLTGLYAGMGGEAGPVLRRVGDGADGLDCLEGFAGWEGRCDDGVLGVEEVFFCFEFESLFLDLLDPE
jgi:hypothetical protein